MSQRKEILARIAELKKDKNAVILAHNYQTDDVQDLADFVGDSLELSRKAAVVEASTIVFCGVHFMAETAAILSPDKTILLPDPDAGCPMADMITARELRLWKEDNPGRKVVCYVNTSAEVKAECDVCCTSSNAAAVVASLGEGGVLFAPDKNLGAWVAKTTGLDIRTWDGYCYVHDKFRPADILEKKAAHPAAEVWAHPECPMDVLALADRVLSTGKMLAEARGTSSREVIIATEKGIIHRLKQVNPGVSFIPARDAAVCVNMKKTTVEKVLASLETDRHRVTVPPETAERARRAIEAMVAIS